MNKTENGTLNETLLLNLTFDYEKEELNVKLMVCFSYLNFLNTFLQTIGVLSTIVVVIFCRICLCIVGIHFADHSTSAKC